MIFSKTVLNVSDNTGLKYVKCLKVCKTISALGKKQLASAGDVLLVSVKVSKTVSIKKGQIFKALVLKTKRQLKRNFGFVNFFSNSVLILDKNFEPVGNRIHGIVSSEASSQNFVKLASIRVRYI